MIYEVRIDIPEDDDTYIKSWGIIAQGDYDNGCWWCHDAWIDFLTLRMAGDHRMIFCDRPDRETDKNAVSNQLRDWYWESKIVPALEKERESKVRENESG